MPMIGDKRRRHWVSVVLLGMGLLTGCGDDPGSADGASEAGSSDGDGELLAWVEELEAGQSTLTLSGTVTSEGENPHDSAATEAIHEDGPDTTTRARVSLVLPAGAEAVSTYQIAAFRDAEDDQVQSQVQDTGMDWIFAREVTGQLYLAELVFEASGQDEVSLSRHLDNLDIES